MNTSKDEVAQVAPPTWRYRLGRWLFPRLTLSPAPDVQGFASGEFVVTTIVKFDWKDRLRLMASSYLVVELRAQTDREVRKANTRAVTSVLPPWFQPPPPQVPVLEEVAKDESWAGRFFTYEELLEDLERWATRHHAERGQLLALGDRGELIQLHHSFGRWVRNWYGLWRENNPLTTLEYVPEVVNGTDVSSRHPDAVSMRLIEDLYKRLQTKTTSG